MIRVLRATPVREVDCLVQVRGLTSCQDQDLSEKLNMVCIMTQMTRTKHHEKLTVGQGIVYTFRAPCEVSLIQAESTVFLVTTANSDSVDATSTELCWRR